jgi:hypothetical protein
VKLFKHRIATNVDQKLDKFSRHRLETFVASVMIQASQAHSAFRFIIRDESRTPIAYVRQLMCLVIISYLILSSDMRLAPR